MAIVVVNHLVPSALSGGFVGVDIFFVISGFLITGHLSKELAQTGTIKLGRFWTRRIRRLLPAAFLVLACSLAAMFLWMPRGLWAQGAEEIAASALYVENWLLALSSVDYFGSASAPSLVQHYWSLSVEEQFYIVWPLALLASVALARAVSRGRWPKLALTIALAVIFIGSLVFSAVVSTGDNPAAYFVTPARAWEFALGGLLAVAPRTKLVGSLSPHLRIAGLWVGLLMMLSSALLFSGDTAFPGVAALLPTLGAALFIAIGDVNQRWSPSLLGGWRPVQAIGGLSYGIYLWHWPAITIYPYIRGRELTGFVPTLALVVLVVAAAAASKYFVEDPLRHSPALSRRNWPSGVFAASGMIAISVLSGLLWVQSQDVRAVRPSAAVPCADFVPEGDALCQEYGSGDRVIVLWGDSHAQVLANTLTSELLPRGVKIVVVSHAGCPPLLGVVRADGLGNAGNCDSLDTLASYGAYVEGREPDAVILAARWSMYLHGWTQQNVLNPETHYLATRVGETSSPEISRDALSQGLEETVRLLGSSTPVIVLGQPPDLQHLTSGQIASGAPIERSVVERWHSSELVLMRDAARDEAFTYLDPLDLFCGISTCTIRDSGENLYSDDNHLSMAGTRIVWNALFVELGFGPE